MTIEDLRSIATVGVGDSPGFRAPLLRDARTLLERLGPRGRAVLLGSIASDKYVELLLEVRPNLLHLFVAHRTSALPRSGVGRVSLFYAPACSSPVALAIINTIIR